MKKQVINFNKSDLAYSISKKLNLKEITASLGNGISFMSLISLTHPQATDGGVYGGDGGGGGGESG